MKKLIALVLALMTVMSLMIPVMASADVTAAATTTMWVNCANGYRLNVRTEPNTNAALLYRLDCGTRVEVNNLVGVPNGWAYVTANGHAQGGYVMTKFLVSKQPGKYEITERSDNFRTVAPYTVTARALNNRTTDSVGLRTSPNKTAKMIRRLVAGDQLQVIAVGKVWSRVVDLTTGQTGYVANDYMNGI